MTHPEAVDRRIGAADVLKEAVAAYGRHAATVIGISVPLQIVGALVSLMILAQTGPLGLSAVGFVATVIAQIMTGTSTLMLLAVRERGEVPPISELLASVLKRLPAMLGLAIVVGLLTAIASVFFLIPGIIVSVAWAVATPALIATRCGITDAMHQSWDITKGYRWDVFVIVILQGATGTIAPQLAARMSNLNLENYVLGLALVNAFLAPLVALALSEMFLRLHRVQTGPPPVTPHGPFVPGAPRPGAPAPAAPYVPVTPMSATVAPVGAPATATATGHPAPMGGPSPYGHPATPAYPMATAPAAGPPDVARLGPQAHVHPPAHATPPMPQPRVAAQPASTAVPPVTTTRTQSVAPPGMA